MGYAPKITEFEWDRWLKKRLDFGVPYFQTNPFNASPILNRYESQSCAKNGMLCSMWRMTKVCGRLGLKVVTRTHQQTSTVSAQISIPKYIEIPSSWPLFGRTVLMYGKKLILAQAEKWGNNGPIKFVMNCNILYVRSHYSWNKAIWGWFPY